MNVSSAFQCFHQLKTHNNIGRAIPLRRLPYASVPLHQGSCRVASVISATAQTHIILIDQQNLVESNDPFLSAAPPAQQ